MDTERTIVEISSSGSDFGVSVLGIVMMSVGFVVFAALIGVGGGIFVYRRSQEGAMRTLAVTAVVGAVALALTVILALLELISTGVFWPLLFVEIGVLSMVFWISMIIDAATREPEEGNNKVVWVIIIVFTQLIGAALYLFVRRPQRIAEVGR